MYYLVRDYYDETKKKIFSDKYDIEECMDEYEDKPMLLVYSWEQGMYNDVRNGKRIYFDQYYILKKSDNVFDLVEVGDLIKIKGNYDEYITQIIENPFWVADLVFFYGNQKVWFRDSQYDGDEQYKNCDLNNIIAIYKPDKHGTYIKVWEKEK